MMNFYERYSQLCEERDIKPCSRQIADMLSVQRATISHWREGTIPTGNTLRIIADVFGVTTDYLLCRTDDPTDYANLTSATQEASAKYAKYNYIIELYERLDATDRVRVEAYMEGILTNEKYARKKTVAL